MLIRAMDSADASAMAPPLDEAFVRALQNDDELGMVVRSHIHVEGRLNEFLDLAVPEPKRLRELKLRYGQRVQLACALGLDRDLETPLNVLGNIRNAFSHKLDTHLTTEMVNELYVAMTRPHGGNIAQGFIETAKQLEIVGHGLRNITPRERFIFCTVYLERAVMANAWTLKEGPRSA